jgi:hypothetical protein
MAPAGGCIVPPGGWIATVPCAKRLVAAKSAAKPVIFIFIVLSSLFLESCFAFTSHYPMRPALAMGCNPTNACGI